MLKRWFINIKWLLNHPPVTLDSIPRPEAHCSYCGSANNLFNFVSEDWAICHACIKKVVDLALSRLTPVAGDLAAVCPNCGTPITRVYCPKCSGEITKWRKKPVIIDAIQLTERIEIPTLEGVMVGDVGDWLITGVKGEKYPCKDDVFRLSYEPIDESALTPAPADSAPWHCHCGYKNYINNCNACGTPRPKR